MTRKELLNSPEYWQEIAETLCYNEGIDYTLQLVDKKQMIDKALEWMKNNVRPYCNEIKYHYDDFVKAMGE